MLHPTILSDSVGHLQKRLIIQKAEKHCNTDSRTLSFKCWLSIFFSSSWPLSRCVGQLHYRCLFWPQTHAHSWREGSAGQKCYLQTPSAPSAGHKLSEAQAAPSPSHLPSVTNSVKSSLTFTQPSTAGFSNPLGLVTALWPYLPPGCICGGFLDLCPSSLNISDGIHGGINQTAYMTV